MKPFLSAAVDEIIARIGPEIRLATPLGLGKPNELINALYERVKNNPGLNLKIYTALSLNPPAPKAFLARRFFEPFAKNHWGENYPFLKYAIDAEKNRLPKNIKVHEFYFRAGSALKAMGLQQDYQCINYTRVAEALYQSEVNVIVQLIACQSINGQKKYSLSGNPDVTLDLIDLYHDEKKPLLKIGVVHPDLPFLGGETEIKSEFFDLLLEDESTNHQLFALPRLPVSPEDHAIGFFVSQLVADDGTLQIGIGSLSDAVISALILRHQKNSLYKDLVKKSGLQNHPSSHLPIETSPFQKGIYGLSEMVTDGYMHLKKADILKRYVTDEKSKARTYLHGAFFLGSKEFYDWLRNLQGADFMGLRMTRVSKVNDLYDPNELLLRAQRKNARFLNTCMQMTVLGGAASETLENGHVVSGVGGQYNFVAMSEELKKAHSILMLRSTRTERGKVYSNIVWSRGHLTVPRHLRDIVITEYGIAYLRNKTDAECIQAMIAITDAQFQKQLVKTAQKEGKLSKEYQIPKSALHNTPERLNQFIRYGKQQGAFAAFPLGSDFTVEEQKIILALEHLQQTIARLKPVAKIIKIVKWLILSGRVDAKKYHPELQRMNLDQTKNLKENFWRRLLLQALSETDLV